MSRAWLLLLAGLALVLPHGAPDRDGRPLGRRLLGPFGSLAAAWEWVAFDAAVHEGQDEAAWLAARRALSWDPLPPAGWIRLAEHLWFLRGSAERVPDPSERTRWFVAGLEVLQEGVEASADPAQVALVRARMLGLYLAPLVADGAIAWPGGLEAVAGAAREAMALAVELGADPSLPEEFEDPLEAFEREHAEGHGHDHDH
ncbi:MAG: hypothetical protein ISQ08_09765 [Planctomycetes bacterium]|nr:hypothetical protein [Planctomycetota bacterium]